MCTCGIAGAVAVDVILRTIFVSLLFAVPAAAQVAPDLPPHEQAPVVEPTAEPAQNVGEAAIDPPESVAEAETDAEEEELDEEPEVRVSAEPGRGFTVAVGDVFSATLRARIQLRNTTVVNGTEVTDNVELRTARIWWTGNVIDPNVRYGVQLALGPNDFEPGNPSPLFDAFIESTHIRELNIKAGQFFVPFDRARTVRESALMATDRAEVIRELTLDRDVGIVVSSSDLFGLGGHLGYSVGFFGGDGRNRVQTAYPGFLYTARISVRPMGAFDDDQESDQTRGEHPRLGLGVAFAYNTNTDRPRSTTGTRNLLVYQRARPDYVHFAADAVFKWAGFSFLGEIVWREADRNSWDYQSDAGANITEHTRSGWGYVFQLGMLVYEGLELWSRWDHLIANEGTAPDLIRQADELGHTLAAGANYYINGHALKLQADWAHSFGDDFLGGTHTIRVQVDASF
jgi:hypothetical protein